MSSFPQLAASDTVAPTPVHSHSGTGKTTLLSRVAALCGAQLVAFNLSQQTDSSDLLGGYKPVDARDSLLPLLRPFLELIRKTFTKCAGPLVRRI